MSGKTRSSSWSWKPIFVAGDCNKRTAVFKIFNISWGEIATTTKQQSKRTEISLTFSWFELLIRFFLHFCSETATIKLNVWSKTRPERQLESQKRPTGDDRHIKIRLCVYKWAQGRFEALCWAGCGPSPVSPVCGSVLSLRLRRCSTPV